MDVYAVGEGVDLNTAASATAIDTVGLDRKFGPGATVVVAFYLSAAAGTSLKLEGSDDDGSSYSALATIAAADGAGTFFKKVTLKQKIRVTVVGTAGSGEVANVYLLAN